MKINSNSVALAGEFAVLSQLALRGYDANMTLGNTKSVDILVSNPANNDLYKLEVKTSYKNKPTVSSLFGETLNWIMSEKHELINDNNLFYCFVNIENKTNLFRFFIVPSKIVAKYVEVQHKFWLDNHPKLKNNVNTLRQFRIGLSDNNYQIPTPLASKYENNWDFNSND